MQMGMDLKSNENDLLEPSCNENLAANVGEMQLIEVDGSNVG